MSLKFSDPKTLKNDLKKIFVKTEEGKPVQIVTKKCDSFGVQKSEKFGTKTVSIVLDEDSKNEMEKIIKNCEEKHLCRKYYIRKKRRVVNDLPEDKRFRRISIGYFTTKKELKSIR